MRACRYSVGECPQRLVSLYAARPFPCHVAAADVDVHGGRIPVQPLLDEPVWFGRPVVDTPLPFLLASFFVCDPPPRAVEVGGLDAFEEAEQVESGRLALVVHVFDRRRYDSHRPGEGASALEATMLDDVQILTALGIDPASLDPAPDVPPRLSGWQARVHPLSLMRRPCSACGEPAVATCRRAVPGLGLRWQDSCRTA